MFSSENLLIYRCHILSWHRYIDDVLAVWDAELSLLDFLAILNSNNYNLKFEASYSESQITFFDVTIFDQNDGSLGTTLFRK